ncbi:bifunctional diguanylate cyclase/phosphodiesterase [Sporosarcina sp. A2]|uniref:bifunctional diguanylate cyclase/phosphodiesterase n=1 Tax=Sporosarcina sp. A2 TaxID=3393449 RepID=UPI003D792700
MKLLEHTHGVGMFAQHNTYFVLLSYLIATISAYASIDLAQRISYTSIKRKLTWLIAGGASLGIGIWSMHFIAMLAFHFPPGVHYDITLVILSVFIAITGCFLGFSIISTDITSTPRFISSGVIMGIGIVIMHYIGIEAVQPVEITYDKTLVLLSIVIAIGASLTALWLGFRSPFSKNSMSRLVKFLFSLVMAVAITGMHYTGMAATQFTFLEDSIDTATTTLDPSVLAWIIAGVTLIVFSFFFFSLVFDKLWRRQEILQHTLLNSSADGIAISDMNGKLVHVNPAFTALFNVDSSALSFNNLRQYHPLLTESVEPYKELLLELPDSTLEVRRNPITTELSGHSLWMFSNVTEQLQSRAHIEQLAFHDTLTGLANRHKLDSELTLRTSTNDEVGCIFLNVDRLRYVNESLSLQAGDALLKKIGSFLKSTLGPNDLLARVAGDEFIILTSDKTMSEIASRADDCVTAIREKTFTVNGVHLNVSLSAGISSYPSQASSGDELLRFANLAMLVSKNNGKNQFTQFTLDIYNENRRVLDIEEALISAIDKGELHLVYQPKVSMVTGETIGVEALLRWIHPTLGFISPVEFIPIGEEKGMIGKIGDWVLQKACTQWVAWHEIGCPPVMMAVNVSPLQLSSDDFLPNILRTAEETGMDITCLELEITETASLAFESAILNKLETLRSLGVQISLDDFGTGYSSFSLLKELPINMLKIDKIFLEDLRQGTGQEAIVRSIIQLGHNLGLDVLAEGVESLEEATWLQSEGCDVVQGYFYYRPQPPENIPHILSQSAMIPV